MLFILTSLKTSCISDSLKLSVLKILHAKIGFVVSHVERTVYPLVLLVPSLALGIISDASYALTTVPNEPCPISSSKNMM